MHEQTLPESSALFTVAGRITDLDPAARRLASSTRMWSWPPPSVRELEPGLVIYVKGYQDPTSASASRRGCFASDRRSTKTRHEACSIADRPHPIPTVASTDPARPPVCAPRLLAGA
jgi:hypothetical protein